ncbi:MAG: hypothetical protein CL441_08000 [Acidimicrobiaceae bacterium]|nr:hypothetical protein [Acidimicrobiaceae bacterium]
MRAKVLRWLRVSEQPAPPPNAGPSLRVFRASRRYLTVRRIQWTLAQIGGLIGILFSLSFFSGGELPVFFINGEAPPEEVLGVVDRVQEVVRRVSDRILGVEVGGAQIFLVLESLAITGYVIQLLFSGFLVTLRWELHWYMVSDESLRIREGLWKLREQTMTVANIQNMKIKQDPLQRLFGLAELEVHTAGGGGKSDEGEGGSDSNLHVGHFRGLENAWAIRDQLREQVARQRSAGLGDPGEAGPVAALAPETPGGQPSRPLAKAAQALLAEARQLGASIRRRNGLDVSG